MGNDPHCGYMRKTFYDINLPYEYNEATFKFDSVFSKRAKCLLNVIKHICYVFDDSIVNSKFFCLVPIKGDDQCRHKNIIAYGVIFISYHNSALMCLESSWGPIIKTADRCQPNTELFVATFVLISFSYKTCGVKFAVFSGST